MRALRSGDYLAKIWDVMQQAIHSGLNAEGVLPGGLGLRRKAALYKVKAEGYGSASIKNRGLVYAYALAVSEHNASGGRVRYGSDLWELWCRPRCTLSP